MDIFEFNFNDLDIKAEDIEILMGFEPNLSPYPFPGWINKELQEAPSLCRIKGGFKIFNNITVDKNNLSLQINNQVFRPGKIIVSQLKNASSVAVFACTAGHDILDISKIKNPENEKITYYIRDLVGSLSVEKAVGRIQDKIENMVKEKKLNITTHFSPGYCDWDVAEQQKLFSLLPANFCGIRLTKSSLMEPVKSISGIIGIGTECKNFNYQCRWCKDKNCIYGKIKRHKLISR